jgi:short-subunit dehydrogenase
MLPNRKAAPMPEPLATRYGPVAVVTGASDGLGAALAAALAARGLSLVLAARRAERLDALATRLAAAHGVAVRTVAADLGTADGVAALLEATAAEDAGLLVAAAGFGSSGPFLDAELAEEQAMLAVNCGATLALTHGFGRRFAARGRGGVVLFSSLVAFQGVPNAAHYAATKAWVQVFAEGIAPEFAARGVDVLAAAPGPVATGFGARARMRMEGTDEAPAVAGEILAALGRRSLLRPGPRGRARALALGLLPRALRVRVMGGLMAGMTRG